MPVTHIKSILISF